MTTNPLQPAPRPPGVPFVTLAAVVVVASIALRWIGLADESLWFDEGYTAWMSSHAPAQIVRLIHADTAPPLYYLLLRAWVVRFGDSEFALRALSAACSSSALVLVGLIAANVLNARWSVLLALALAGTSLLQVQYAREARFYALMLLESTALLYTIIRWRASGAWRWVAPIVVSATAALYTNNALWFYVPAACGFALIWPGVSPPRRFAQQAATIALLVVLLYLPWLPTFFSQSRAVEGHFWIARPTLHDFSEVLAALCGSANYLASKSVVGWFHLPATSNAVIAATLFAWLLLLITGMTNADRASARRLIGLLTFALIPVVTMYAYSLLRQPVFMVKPLIGSSPALLLGGALSVQLAWKKTATRFASLVMVGVLCALSVSSTIGFLKEDQKEDWRRAARFVQALPPAQRLIVFVASEGQLPFDYYDRNKNDTRTGAPAGFFDLDPPRTMRRVLSDGDLNALRQRLNSNHFDEVVLVSAHTWFADPEDRVATELNVRGMLMTTRELNKITVRRFALRSP